MKKILPLLALCIISSIATYGQKKSELVAQIGDLRMELDSVKGLVSDAQRGERISTTKANSLQSQVTELQDANAALLKNLNSFATVSSKNSDNVNRAMASLQAKESQLKAINDAIASNDSTAIVVMTNAKQTLGENAKIGVSNGALIISEGLETLFGGSSNVTLTPEAEPWLANIAKILKANPKMDLTIEGLSMTGELDLARQQATAISLALQQQFEINPERITTSGKDGNFKEGVALRIHPKYDAFYMMVKENMKNGN
ncbi:hypothetical protein N9954_03595 [Maribacter sp.]|nr:hypothetical protein [Maribacter sp.]